MTDNEVLEMAREIKKSRRTEKLKEKEFEKRKRKNTMELVYEDIDRIKDLQNEAIIRGDTERLRELDEVMTERLEELIELRKGTSMIFKDVGILGLVLGTEYCSRIMLPDKVMRFVKMFIR